MSDVDLAWQLRLEIMYPMIIAPMCLATRYRCVEAYYSEALHATTVIAGEYKQFIVLLVRVYTHHTRYEAAL